jgi:hypothetical protein
MYCKNSACSEESLQQTTGKKCPDQLFFLISRVANNCQNVHVKGGNTTTTWEKVIQNTVCCAYLILGTVKRDTVV